MKASLYDYRVPPGEPPRHLTIDVPPEHEERFALFLRNDWAIGLFRKPGQTAPYFQAGIVDILTDVFLASDECAAEDEVGRAITALCAIEPPALDAALRAAVTRAPGPSTHDLEEET